MKKILTEQRLCELAGIVTEAPPRTGGTQEIDDTSTQQTLPPLSSLPPTSTPAQSSARYDLSRAHATLKRFFFDGPFAEDKEEQAKDFVTGTQNAAARLTANFEDATTLADAYREMQKVPSDISPQDIKRALLINANDYWLGRHRPDWKKLRTEEPELAKIAIRIANATDFDFLEFDSLRKKVQAPAASLANLFAQPWRKAQQDLFDEEVTDSRENLATRDPDRKGASTEDELHLRRVNRLARALNSNATDDADAGQMFIDFFSERATEEYKDIVTNPPKLEKALKEFDNLIKQKQQQIKSRGAAARGNRPSRPPKSWLPKRAGGTWEPPEK
tara:strand:- start:785 stop:1780 length:996 start_codon:yes stop_codon:yes gene_type:complete